MSENSSFFGYVKGGPKRVKNSFEKNYLKTEDGDWKKSTKFDKQCSRCRYFASVYNNEIDFWCKHQKERMQKFHPSTRWF